MRDSNRFYEYCNTIGYELEKNQKDVVDLIFANMDKGIHVQTVIMPSNSGKSSLSLLLSGFLKDNVLLYASSAIGITIRLNSFVNKIHFENVTETNPLTIIKEKENKFEYMIVDGISDAAIDSIDVDQKLKLLDEDLDAFYESTSHTDFLKMGYIHVKQIYENNKCNTIIFLSKEDYTICKDLDLLKKGVIIDLYPDIKKYQSEYEKKLRSSGDLPTYEENVNTYFNMKLNQMNSKLDSINEKMNELISISKSIQNEVESKKLAISTFEEFSDDEDMIESFTENVLTKLLERMGEEIKTYEKMNSYQQYRKLVEIKMGQEAWNKMDEDSKRFITTAKFTFAQNIILGNEIDYSSICLLVSKALEIEVAKRFIEGYEEYLRERYSSDFSKWPTSLFKYDRHGLMIPLTLNDFMLGRTPYIIGLKTRNKEDRKNLGIFREYCINRLLGCQEEEVDEVIQKLNTQINNVKDRYRNPAAHKDTVTMIEASDCIDYVLEVERVLAEMMALFKF